MKMHAVSDARASPAASLPKCDSVEDTLWSFRQAMRRHAAGVCVISAGRGENVNGMAATAVTSFSMDPPSLLICVNEAASIASQLGEGSAFGVTILGRDHEFIAAAFSRKPSGRARFAHGAWQLEAAAPPWLSNAPANMSCVVARTMTYGTHLALIGHVVSVRIGPDAPSLIYRDGQYD